ncbi:hypothetical protein LguiA_035055 [Lonicera macranthoides]
MECSSDKPNTRTIISSNSSPKGQNYYSLQSSTSTVPISQVLVNNVVITPCAACKVLRRRCTADKCVLAPFFPPTDPLKFIIAHRVFGASNIIKMLQELPEFQRADAVSSLVYEANARIKDPIYGSAGTICHLQKQVSDLQAELSKAQAELVNLQCQQTNLMALICMEMAQPDQQQSISQLSVDNQNLFWINDDASLRADWETPWT